MSPAGFRIFLAAIAAFAVSACDDRERSIDAPKIVQLNCQPDKGGRPMVFVVDTGLREAVWVNGANAPKASATLTEREYRVRFSSPASELTINRYDGVMTLVHGSDHTLNGKCSRTKTGAPL